MALRNVTVVILTIDEPKLDNLNGMTIPQPSPKQDADRAGNIHTYICDVSDYDQVQKVAEKVRTEVGARLITPR